MNVVSREAGTAKSVAGSYCVKNGNGIIIDVLHLYCEHFIAKQQEISASLLVI